ncbi:MAG: hypothetical protein ACTHKV_06775 [Flavipsychrobacter sp.]
MKKLTFFTLLWLAVFSSRAQDAPVSFLSEPINISTEGWNKVLQMKNGNTLLFHFELKKSTIVKVFNKDHKEIASVKPDFKLIDVRQIDNATFQGLIDVGGEATLFISQQVDNVNTLVRLRFNGANGELTNEDRVVRSASLAKETQVKVLKSEKEEGYHIACFTYKEPDTSAIIKLMNFNGKNEEVNEIPYEIPTRGFDFTTLVTSDIDRAGNILIVSCLAKIIQYPELMDRTLVINYLPKNEGSFTNNFVKLPENIALSYVAFAVNPFANNINWVVNKEWVTKYGDKNISEQQESMYIIPESITAMKERYLNHDTANKSLAKLKGDTSARYWGNVKSMYTNNLGKTTVFFENRDNITDQQRIQNNRIVCAGDICMAEYDDNGTEISSILLPKSNYYAPVTYPPLAFGTVSEWELYSSLFFNSKKSHYIVYNESAENYSIAPGSLTRPVFNYDNTDATFYHITKDFVTKQSFILPENNCHHQLYIGSACYDEKGNSIAGLMKQNKAGQTTLHLLWYKFID